MLNNFVAVPLPADLYHQLLARHSRPQSVIEDVLVDFLSRTAEDLPATKKGRGHGLHWELAFLPEKTKLRTKHRGEYKYAEIKGDYVVYDGHAFTSVAAAINKMRGDTSNNAWKVAQVMRPSDSEWIGALRIRRRDGI